MSRKSERTSAPSPHAIPPPCSQPAPSPATPSIFRSGAWCPPYPPPQFTASSSTPSWFAGLQQPWMVGSSSAQDSWRAPTGIGAPNTKDPDVQAWGADSHPPGGFLDFLNRNIPVQLQGVSD
uniref:Uncharacterized protein n=1 Tax=Oryza brachyantha TaxID=4533 RepID=J3N330_ORYBR